MPKQTSLSTPISVVINTKNAAATIEKAIESVKSWADEIIIVDMKSTDETTKIAKKLGAKVVAYDKDHKYADPARNFANDQAKNNWVVVLDADEIIPVTLVEWIQLTLSEPAAAEVSCYWLPRQNYIFGQWVEHSGWWPDHQPRLFQKGTVTWHDGVHKMPTVKGTSIQVSALPELSIKHQNYTSVSEFIEKLNRYTDLKAEEVSSVPVQPGADQVMLTFFSEFQRRFFLQQGIKDGTVGAGLSLLQAMYELTVELKRREKLGQLVDANPESQQDMLMKQLKVAQRQLQYWIANDEVSKSSGGRKIWWQIRRKLHI